MPYIKREDRTKILEGLELVPEMNHPGELNYAITVLCHCFLENNGGLNYRNVNEVIGVLECAKMELYRKVAVPYEEKKIELNGDVETEITSEANSMVNKCGCK